MYLMIPGIAGWQQWQVANAVTHDMRIVTRSSAALCSMFETYDSEMSWNT
jgi:hypothetical protein